MLGINLKRSRNDSCFHAAQHLQLWQIASGDLGDLVWLFLEPMLIASRDMSRHPTRWRPRPSGTGRGRGSRLEGDTQALALIVRDRESNQASLELGFSHALAAINSRGSITARQVAADGHAHVESHVHVHEDSRCSRASHDCRCRRTDGQQRRLGRLRVARTPRRHRSACFATIRSAASRREERQRGVHRPTIHFPDCFPHVSQPPRGSRLASPKPASWSRLEHSRKEGCLATGDVR